VCETERTRRLRATTIHGRQNGRFHVAYSNGRDGSAGEVIQRLELAKDGDIDGSTEDLLHLVERGDLVTQQKRVRRLPSKGDTPVRFGAAKPHVRAIAQSPRKA